MMNFRTFLSFLAAGLLLLLSACSFNHTFKVSGTLEGAEGKTIYLVRQGLDGAEISDSCTVSSSGNFSFKAPSPKSPEFYTIEVDSLLYWVAIDSTELVQINASLNKYPACQVQNSLHTQQLQQFQQHIRLVADSVKQAMVNFYVHPHEQGHRSLDDSVYTIVGNYKKAACHFIQHNATSPVAYYLLFKKVAMGICPFDAYAPEDFHYFALVAGNWNKHYANSDRALQLKNLIQDVSEKRAVNNRNLVMGSMQQSGFIDLNFPDRNGVNQSLSSHKGHTVLLEFCYLAQLTPDVQNSLLAVYKALHPKGLDIYMVTFDKNKNVWRRKAAAFPWPVVLDADGSSAATYNFTVTPSNYLFSADGNILGRDVSLLDVMRLFADKK